jgi:organic radical activating enzyme
VKIKNIVQEDFVNYKKPSMFIIFPKCSFKCDRECGRAICQNSALVNSPDIEISTEKIVEKYINNPITKSIVIGGLEPFDSIEDLDSLLRAFREKTKDEIIIYTGYTE